MSEASATPPTSGAIETLVTDGTFEQALAALEDVIALLEQGRLPMEESLRWYELGLGLTKRCADLLQQAELRVSTIEGHYGIRSIGGPGEHGDDA